MDPIALLIVLLVLGILLALLILVIAVATRSIKEHRGRVILLGVGLFFIIGFLSLGWFIEYESRNSDLVGANFAFSQAASEAKLHELVTDYELADSATRAKLYPEVLKICKNSTYGRYIPTYSIPSCIWESAEKIGWEIRHDCQIGIQNRMSTPSKVVDASGIATLWILSEGNDLRCKVGSLRSLMCYGYDWIIWDNMRISNLLNDDKGSSRNAQYNAYINRLIAYSLLSWNVRKQRYSNACDKLQVALGEEWLSSGVIDSWWKKNLPPRAKDHLLFGYILYKSGHRDKALREYRLAKGSAKSENTMQREYEKEFRF